jgi:hypothetical protein
MGASQIRIEIVPRKEPDIGLYARALIALVEQRKEPVQESHGVRKADSTNMPRAASGDRS